ncbi:glyoxalase/bleomycin resistance protein/dioxygenase superfamily protein [Williamsia limnetica]|uniref:Glyoxalase/bleomycin resistance protein/dioxygenase superfamily protein n=2 Tax=Williamsia limnetica TaxID=882452 RepID=A0A318RD73_WILLI|nr:glyoxalase/bleomycin resistance protein/dioxygenase superfamily protein [Williamsia limnetica]
MTEYTPGAIVQIAYVVDDVRAAAEDFASRTGAGPFFVRRNQVTSALGPDGTAGSFDHSSAYGQWGHTQIEFVEVHSAEPAAFAQTALVSNHIHHVAIMVSSFGDQQRQFADSGWPAVLTATTPNGNNFAFHDARAQLGHLVEIYEPRPTILALYRRVADAAVDWDGRDPVRDM